MEFKDEYLIISNDINLLLDESLVNYVAHLVCNKGELHFTYHETEMVCPSGNGLIGFIGHFTEVSGTEDLSVKMVFTHRDFLYMANPQSNFGVQGTLNLFLNPVISLNAEELELLNRDMDNLAYRKEHTVTFRHDVLQCATQMMFLDYFQPHARAVKDQQINSNTATAMVRFIGLLNGGAYRQHRDVAWYASELCMTAKYLSEISIKCSGFPAGYWIQRFTVTEIHRRLKDRFIPINSIIEEFGFASPSSFSLYVQKHLGKNPSEFRS